MIASKRILVSLSGGGYRAALFNAGVLRVLNELGLVALAGDHPSRNVIVNAVSGGSIPAALWDRFLKSSEYANDAESLEPEKQLLQLVCNSPSGFGSLSWHFRGMVKGAQRAWLDYLTNWWTDIPWREEVREQLTPLTSFTRPGYSQFFPAFLLQSVEFNRGRVLAYFENKYFVPDRGFFKKGEIPYDAVGDFSYPHAIVAATAFPVFFPSVVVGTEKVVDAGLIDNQGIFNFLPLIQYDNDVLLGDQDEWYLSDTGAAMAVVGLQPDDHGAGDTPTTRLRLRDRIFRMTGALSQPKVQQAITNLVSVGLKAKVVGVKISYSSHGSDLWFSGPSVKTPQDSANFATTLSWLSREDAVAILAHGAQCAAIGFGLSEALQNGLKSRLGTLLED